MKSCVACKANQDKCENGVCEIKTLRMRVKELEKAHLAEHQAAVDMFCKYDKIRDKNVVLQKELNICKKEKGYRNG